MIPAAPSSKPPDRPRRNPIPRWSVVRFSAVELLVALALLFVTTPMVSHLAYGHWVQSALLTVVMVFALLAAGARGRTLGVGLLLLFPAAAVLLLAACQQPAPAPVAPPPKEVQSGYIFVLGSPLAFPPENPELLFQDVQIVNAAGLSPEMPYCRLKPERGAPEAIAPGNLTVVAVTYDERGSGAAGGGWRA